MTNDKDNIQLSAVEDHHGILNARGVITLPQASGVEWDSSSGNDPHVPII
jgi:hypothetical protein